ncbi:V-set domain containing T-cell activation inhibitor 1-like isoform X2 [Archocentrus centrarchus]|uniref:V-set domain containing T-cell activation inhibitor 1-like isoform X2 n=1 Tax=Archocentrus centrarchus TaxID=63155 RepID=UPI0011E9D0CB|nr:V-set domain containing T-cell activation inhibitor 1-like isoform X2 [Archocentrus centrarchus]
MEVKVRPGQDATLQCRGPGDAPITLLEWIRPELLSDGYVFFFQDQRWYENYQHDFFKGRVELRDPSMKDGDVSVIVRNVSIRDTGTYECVITSSSIRGGERVINEFKHSINLTVTASDENAKGAGHKDGGHKDAFLSFIISVPFFVVLIIGIVCIISCRKSKETSDRSRLYS